MIAVPALHPPPVFLFRPSAPFYPPPDRPRALQDRHFASAGRYPCQRAPAVSSHPSLGHAGRAEAPPRVSCSSFATRQASAHCYVTPARPAAWPPPRVRSSAGAAGTVFLAARSFSPCLWLCSPPSSNLPGSSSIGPSVSRLCPPSPGSSRPLFCSLPSCLNLSVPPPRSRLAAPRRFPPAFLSASECPFSTCSTSPAPSGRRRAGF
mmetsp:Transcript_16225/g.40041  ORF Transcript_16225/g.40041 Transcript_16225/m.40041 type:complete len:207 (+) Transcript_16225:1794-2414(+)